MTRGFLGAPAWAWVTMALSVIWLIVGGLLIANQEVPQMSEAEQARLSAAIEAAEAAEPPVVAFLGDSYTAASTNGNDGEYVYAVSETLGWEPVVFGQGGTGYVNPGQAEENEAVYLERVPDVIAAEPDIVVVQGGGNDALVDPDCEIQDEVGAVLTSLREQLPEARIIALASVPGPDVDRTAFSRCAEAIAAAAAPLSIPVIDPAALGWLADPTLFVDGFHPTVEGYAQMASLLAEQLRPLTA